MISHGCLKPLPRKALWVEPPSGWRKRLYMHDTVLFESIYRRVSAEVSEAYLPRSQLLEVEKKYMLKQIYKNM